MSTSAEKLERRLANASYPLNGVPQTPYSSPMQSFQMSPRYYQQPSLVGSPYRQMTLPPAPSRQSPTLSPRFPQRPMSLPAARPPSPRLPSRFSAPYRYGYDGHCTR